MNIKETGELLAKIATLDNRKVDEATIIVWYEALKPYTWSECNEALLRVRRSTAAWVMPSHIIDYITEWRSQYRMANPGARKPFEALVWDGRGYVEPEPPKAIG